MSILDINEQIEDQTVEILGWLNQICTYYGLKPVLREGTNIVDMISNNPYEFDQNVKIKGGIKSIPSDFKFGRIEGSFICNYCDLEDCNGFPNEIYTELRMQCCLNIEEIPHFDKLTSFYCAGLDNLVKINKLPDHLGGIVDFKCCPKIVDLDWFPQRVGGNVWIDSQYQNEDNEKFLKSHMSRFSDLYWTNIEYVTSMRNRTHNWCYKSIRYNKNI